MAKRVSSPDSSSVSSSSSSPYKKRKPSSLPFPLSDSASSDSLLLTLSHSVSPTGDHHLKHKSFENASSGSACCVSHSHSHSQVELEEKETGSKMEQDHHRSDGGRSMRSGRRAPQAEIDEFFSTAEKYEQKRFTDKYNYDVVKDSPLEGRYHWVLFNP